jgi:hypothetical protein
MTVEELICKLMRIEDKEAEVIWDNNFGPIESIKYDGYYVRIW